MKYFFPPKCFCQKIWYGHVECTFDKLARKNLRTGQKFSAQCPRTVEREFQEKSSPQNLLLHSDGKNGSDNVEKNYPTASRKCFVQCQKTIEKKVF